MKTKCTAKEVDLRRLTFSDWDVKIAAVLESLQPGETQVLFSDEDLRPFLGEYHQVASGAVSVKGIPVNDQGWRIQLRKKIGASLSKTEGTALS